jgi:glucose-1-phosphate thymidylyltransferase
MKGIILAGGSGTRLSPLTIATSKQLMPVYDKPMIYYPLSTLMLAGIREILVITTPHEADQFKRLLGDGSQWGVSISYAPQEEPRGLAEAFIIAEDFIEDSNVALILGDNIFHGEGMGRSLQDLSPNGATIFAHKVANPSDYGVIEFDSHGKVLSIEEKPTLPKSTYVVPGLYFYDASVVAKAKTLKPSARGELEITDLHAIYLNQGKLSVKKLEAGTQWVDTGSIDSLHDASIYVRGLETRLGQKINVPEEIAWRLGYIDDNQLLELAGRYSKSGYGTYLRNLIP